MGGQDKVRLQKCRSLQVSPEHRWNRKCNYGHLTAVNWICMWTRLFCVIYSHRKVYKGPDFYINSKIFVIFNLKGVYSGRKLDPSRCDRPRKKILHLSVPSSSLENVSLFFNCMYGCYRSFILHLCH